MKRQLFNTLEELRIAIKTDPKILGKKMPYIVIYNGQKKFVLSGNSDQALAAVVRELGACANAVPLTELFDIAKN